MKKAIRNIGTGLLIVIALMMVPTLSACGESKDNAEPKSFYAQGLEVIQLMSEMTRTEEYLNSVGAISNQIEVIQKLGAGDYSSPKAVYAISVTDDNLAVMIELNRLGNASEELKNYLMQRVIGSLMTSVNGMNSSDSLIVSSVCSAGKTFVNQNAAEDVIYLYTYEDASPVAVTFIIGEEQTVSASGTFILNDQFTCGSADEIKSFFSKMIFINMIEMTVDVTEVQIEK